MANFDPIEKWFSGVAFRRGNRNRETEKRYRRSLNDFCKFISKAPPEIVEEYETIDEKVFKRKYAQFLKSWISSLMQQNYAISSIATMIIPIRSFFKYSDLPLGYVPTARRIATYHNRDITKEEVQRILEINKPRDKAFFCMMAQTGLRPITLCNLKLKHLEPDFSQRRIPCKIEVPIELAKGQYRPYFTFMAPESVKYLKAYFATRPGIGPEDYVFTGHGRNRPLDRSGLSHIFKKSIETLKKKGFIDYQQKQGKPGTLRLYTLRKYFRKQAHQAGFELVQFWMGHVVHQGVDEHYRPRDVEFHRKLFAEKAMPFLRLETATPSETENLMAKLSQENKDLKRQIAELNEKFVLSGLVREQMEKIAEGVKKWEKEKCEIEAKIAGIENFQKMVLDQPDEEILKFIRDIRRQLKEQRS